MLRAPALDAGHAGLTFLLALPLAIALRGDAGTAPRREPGGRPCRSRVERRWAAEFEAQAPGLGRTFTHEILGFGGTLANVSGLLDAGRSIRPSRASLRATSRCGCSCPAGSSIGSRAAGPFGRRPSSPPAASYFVALPAPRRRDRRGVLGSSSAGLHPFLFGTRLRPLDARS